MATIAMIPNASVSTLPPTASVAPVAKGSKKVAVIVPEATPPESKAMAKNIFGTKNIRAKAIK